jgi:hypothetical protein
MPGYARNQSSRSFDMGSAAAHQKALYWCDCRGRGSHRMTAPFPFAADLPACLTFTGEFGAEVNSFVPFVHWLHQAGLMHGRRIRTYNGMRPFYFFLDAEQIEEVAHPRQYVFPQERPAWLPTRDDHMSVRSPFLMFPDYRKHFRDGMFDVGRPLLIVHNKVTPEWGRAPIIDPAAIILNHAA